MTKADIVKEIAMSTGLDKAAVLTTIEKFMEVMKDSMANGNNVYLRGFGSLSSKREKKKQLVTFQRTLSSKCLNTRFRLSNLQRFSLTR